MPSFGPVIALSRGLAILRVVNAQKQASVGSIHRDTQLNKATIVRMLETLEHEGYIVRDAGRAVYAPTGRTLELSQGYDMHVWIGGLAEPILGEFRKSIGWPSDVALLDGDAMVVVQTSRGHGPLSFNRRPGYRAPVLATSIGRAYLAFCDEDERARIVAHLATMPGQWNDLARHPRRLKTILDEVRERGFAVMDEAYSAREYDNMMWALAVPVKDGRVYASLNIMMLKSVVTLDEAVARYLEPLRRTAAKMVRSIARMPAR